MVNSKLIKSFVNIKEKKIENYFLKNGYYISEVEDLKTFNLFENEVNNIFKKILQTNIKKYNLETIHQNIAYDKINEVRVKVFNELNKFDWLLPTYYSFAKKALDTIVGNEICMQKQLNLSIQMPKDNTSTLPIHADSFNGESPFQVVLWIPMTDAYKSNSMFIIDPNNNSKILKKIKKYKNKEGIKKIYSSYKKNFKFLNIKKGNFLIFSSNLLHGNVVNKEKTSRISFNTRVKSLFSPYGSDEKNIGNFYQPNIIKPATTFGLNFETPE